MQFVLFEDHSVTDLLPFTFTRPIFDLRVGIDTIYAKWQGYLSHKAGGILGTRVGGCLAPCFSRYNEHSDTVFINGKILPDPQLLQAIDWLTAQEGALLSADGDIIAFRKKSYKPDSSIREIRKSELLDALPTKTYDNEAELLAIRTRSDIFSLNHQLLVSDFARLTANRQSVAIQDRHTVVYNEKNIFIEEGVQLKAAILNAEAGPIYIGKNATIEEGAVIHGAHAICDHATVHIGAKLRGDSTIGPWSKVGGEIANSVLWGYSNKGHDGYLGNSVLGQWCNLGADTNVSNLKNNYSSIKTYSYNSDTLEDTGKIFCGLMMGDHSKCGINTMFNTGTVVGVSANIYGGNFPPKHIPSFSWGGSGGFVTFDFEKAIDVATRVMKRRKCELTTDEKNILWAVYNATSQYRQ